MAYADKYFNNPFIVSCVFFLVLFFNNYKFKLKEAYLCLEKQNKRVKLSYRLLTWPHFKRGSVLAEDKSYTMNGASLRAVVLKGDNSIVDKIIILWWHLWKRSPWQFLNNSKLLGNSSRDIQPVAHGLPAAQDGCESGPTQNCKFTQNIMRYFFVNFVPQCI